jgi:prolyl-tRNA editing enzyme YbaK/EbsC (Cys-tRNA(Pro) deacylase)
MSELHPAAERVQRTLRELGFGVQVQELPQSTRTAKEAAAAVGVTVGQIVKSLVFVAGDEPVLVCASGSNRISVEKLSQLVGKPVRQASPEEVKETTGFAIGGVPPVGHVRKLKTFIDRDLLHYDEIWAAGGTPRAVFRTTPDALIQMTQGDVADVKE